MPSLTKERKDSEKKINVALEGHLMELTSAKSKSHASCKYAVKEFANLELQLSALELEIQNEDSVINEITKKIYSQFSTQIEELFEVLT
jgi:hypothetical protein